MIKKLIAPAIAIFAMFIVAVSVASANLSTANPEDFIKTVTLDKFELADTWQGSMANDKGMVTIKKILGGPDPSRFENPVSNVNRYKQLNKFILGVKVDYFKTGHSKFSVSPPRRIDVPGIAQTLSVWVAGRGYNHMLNFIVDDYFGTRHRVFAGTLNFIGWKKLKAALPKNVRQRDDHMSQREYGIKLVGLEVVCDPLYTSGSYYIYFDNLETRTELFLESAEARDPDDPIDDWSR